MAGELMRSEMNEQPAVLAGLLARRSETVRAVRATIGDQVAGIVVVARGSSDNAALHARYLLEITTGRPVALAAPSLWTRYGTRTELDGWVAVAVSQSGRTPEIVDTVVRMRDTGAKTIAVTNDERSDLAAASHVVVPLGAGPERAVPATKTVTGSVLALIHIAAGLGQLPWTVEQESRLPDDVAAVLADAAPVAATVDDLLDAETVHLGRGYTLPVALESALKFKETSLRSAQGYATGDFLHGPVAAVRRGSAVLAYAAAGPTFADVAQVAELVASRGLPVTLVSDSAGPGGVGHLAVPAGLPEPVAAIPMVVRGQQLAWETTIRLGLDPDRPDGLNKVTVTR